MPGLTSTQRLVAQAPPLEAARAHRLDHGVGPAHQVEERLAASVGAQVERDRALAPADVQVHQRDALDDGPGHLADVVARGRLDLDDVGAEVGQVGGDGARSEHRALDDADARQGRSPGAARRSRLGSSRHVGRHDHRTGSDTPSDQRFPPDVTRPASPTIYGVDRWGGDDRWGSPTVTQRCETISIVTNSFHQPHRTARAGAPLVALPLEFPPHRAPTEGDPC